MSDPLFLVTGFGAFEDIEDNPSGRLVERLDADPPAKIAIAVRILPVSFRGSASELDAALSAIEPRHPDAIIALGLNSKGECLRIERRATTELKPGRPDILGVDAEGLKLPEDQTRETTLDLELLQTALEQPNTPQVVISEDAGGFVCERLYHHALKRSAELGIPAVFIHVPPTDKIKLDVQLRSIRQMLAAVAKEIAGTSTAPVKP